MNLATSSAFPVGVIRGVFCVGVLVMQIPLSATAATAPSDSSAPAEAADASGPVRSIVSDADWEQASRDPLSAGEIDRLIARERPAGEIPAPPLTTDEQFLRRISLDLTGQLPTPEEITEFLAESRADKRARVIDRLLESDDFARHQARYWRDVVTSRLTMRRSMGLTRSFEEWLFEQIRAERNWGEITEDILTASGELRFTLNRPSSENGQLFFLVARDNDGAEERAAETSRVFLGIQIQCAQCHDHPSEKWKREQFHELAAYFARVKYEQLFVGKKLSGVQLITLEDREHRMEVFGNPEETVEKHPRFLDGQSPGQRLTDSERRRSLAELVTSKNNHWFAAAFVNRVWNEMMGWSFYQHVDDLGANKQVVYPAVLTRLTGAFRGSDYDLRAVFRAVANSQAYQRRLIGKVPVSGYSAIAGAAPTPLRADVLWDSLAHVLGKIEHGYRFHTGSGVRFSKSFLQGHFQAEFDFDPSADRRDVQRTLPQALMLMNNPKLNERIKVKRGTLLEGILKATPDDSEALDLVYHRVLARKPTERERERCLTWLRTAPDRSHGFEDILWALINSTEFQTKR